MTGSRGLCVSRETFAQLETFAELLKKWNPHINLVSKTSIDDLWHRHIRDSAQIFYLVQHPVNHWVDLGSGGGFPGLVIAIMGHDGASPAHVTLVESDRRKATFLRTVIRETGARANVLVGRIEEIEPLQGDVISARAVADLSTLLSFVHHHLKPDGTAIFPKGGSWKNELSAARTRWNFHHRVDKSKIEVNSVVLSIKGVSRA